MTTAAFLGTFDPFHGGHIGQLLRAHHATPLSKAYILINKHPQHKPNASSWQHRLQMTQLCMEAIDLPFDYEVIGVEGSLASDFVKPVDYKIVGIDSLIEDLADPDRWQYARRWTMLVLSIPGIPDTRLPDAITSLPQKTRQAIHYQYISESDAPMMNYDFGLKAFVSRRVHSKNLRSGENTTLVPEEVRRYAAEHGLYP